jgi:TolA-binding protein
MTLERLAREVARAQDELLADPRRRNVVRARLEAGSPLQRVERGSRRSLHASWALVAAVAAAIGFWFGRPAANRAVDPRPGAWQTASETASLPLEFSDGSEVVLSPRARARVLERDSNGARVYLERGRAHVSVVHRPSTRWGIEAGPFDVAVTGTRFDMEWEPGDETLSVKMDEGKVEISGCGLGVRRVTAGESVRFSCRNNGAIDTEGKPAANAPPPDRAPEPATSQTSDSASTKHTAPPPSPPVSDGPTSSTRDAVVPTVPAPSAVTGPAASADWRGLASNARYADAFAAVDGSAFDRECETADATSLLTLANVARLTGHAPHAQRALLALRRRFTTAPGAAMAAFDLGMIDADQQHDPAGAARWFATYLEETPRGPLAREALGRLVEAESQSGHEGRAREAARRYLKEYPTGPRADLARSLLGHD